MGDKWWRSAVVYQVYIRSFDDSNSDGVGDLPGLRSRLPYLASLGVDAVWITPFFPSPQADHGYDVADYRDVDPLFGTVDDFDALVRDAHAAGIRLLVDLVPNHTSDRHRWFRNGLTSRDHPDREKYVWRDGKADGSPPNNWQSAFGGPAWTFHEPTGQWYLHLFAPGQPDLNWRNPEVRSDFENVVRFWLDRGADGFRIDVAHALVKDEALRDNPEDVYGPTAFLERRELYHHDRPEVHDIWRDWRRLVDSHPGDPVLVGEVVLPDPVRIAQYVRPDELHLAFSFLLVGAWWDARHFRYAIDRTIEALAAVESSPAWVLSNHDVPRHATRYGGGEQGLRRARAASLVMLALPGTCFLYNGEELGLEDADVPPEARQDPLWFQTNGALVGRDPCRVPIPWGPDAPGYGFTTGTPWLPMPPGWGERSVVVQEEDAGSTLTLYRRAIASRRELASEGFEWLDAPDGCLAFRQGSLACACNFGSVPAELALGGELRLSSDDGASVDGGRLTLSPDSAAWLYVPSHS